MLTVQQAAEKLKISTSLIYELCSTGKIAHARFGRQGKRGAIRISLKDLEDYQASCRRDKDEVLEDSTLKYL